MSLKPLIVRPPGYCQYAGGPCDQSFEHMQEIDAFFAFASDPENNAATLQAAVEQLTRSKPNHRWVSWRDLAVGGQIIFCEICRHIRFCQVFVADLTVLNFNVVFELGYAVGLGKPVRLLRDSSYARDARDLEEFGIVDTVGYEAYSKSDDIVSLMLKDAPRPISTVSAPTHYRASPIYVVLPSVETEGVALTKSSLKQSAFQYRVFDPKETPRLTLAEVQRHVASSIGVVLPLLDEKRAGARIHNARCAFVAGLAMAQEKHVLLAQEGHTKQPIDYRDVCQTYSNPRQVQPMLERLVKQVATTLSSTGPTLPPEEQRTQLAKLDLGDIAAENEDEFLISYFVKTAQFQETLRGHARLVTGRKGTGKSAIFSQLRDAYIRRTHDFVILDLRPEGYQLRKYVELLRRITDEGTREQTAITLWYYVLLTELAYAVLERDVNVAYRDQEILKAYRHLEATCDRGATRPEEDFSERLMTAIRSLADSFNWGTDSVSTAALNHALWAGDIAELRKAISDYLKWKKEIWILVDNLDKGWPTHGATEHELIVLRGLLEASRKLQRELGRRDVAIRNVVFIRTDVFEQLVSETPDRGKETSVNLDGVDQDVLREILCRRAVASLSTPMTFEDFAQRFFDMHVGGEDSFKFLFRHTFGRPRDVLRLVKRCVEVALNRGHTRVAEADIRAAVEAHSNDVLRELVYEVRDSLGDDAVAIEELLGARQPMTAAKVEELLAKAAPPGAVPQLVRSLIWYSFLGVQVDSGERYAYEEHYNVDRLLRIGRLATGEEQLVVHPAFRYALKIRGVG